MNEKKFNITAFTEKDKKFYDLERKLYNRKVLIQIQDLLQLPGLELISASDGNEDILNYIRNDENQIAWIDKNIKFKTNVTFQFSISANILHSDKLPHNDEVSTLKSRIIDLETKLHGNSLIAAQAKRDGLTEEEIENIKYRNAGDLADKSAGHELNLAKFQADHDKEMSRLTTEHQRLLLEQKSIHDGELEKYKTDQQSSNQFKIAIVSALTGLAGIVLGTLIKPVATEEAISKTTISTQSDRKELDRLKLSDAKAKCKKEENDRLAKPCWDQLKELDRLAKALCSKEVEDCFSSVDVKKCRNLQGCASRFDKFAYGSILKIVNKCTEENNLLPSRVEKACE